MRTFKTPASKLQPLGISLTRFRSTAAVIAALLAAAPASQAQFEWDGSAAIGTPGDGLLWTDRNNWTDLAGPTADVLPLFGANVSFGNPAATPGTIHLSGNQTIGTLGFTESYTLGAFGSTNVLTTLSPAISVASGEFATINAILAGGSGINLTGGGTLFLTNNLNQFTGNITVDGAGSTLLAAYPGQPTPASRSDALVLGQTGRTISLSNGGTMKFIGSSYNPDGGTKSYAFGDGGGILNIAAGFQRMTLDDASQIQVFGANPAFVKDGAGSVQLISQDFNVAMTGGVTVNAGVLQLGRTQGNVAGARFSAFTTGSAIEVKSGGHLTLSGTTVGVLDETLTLKTGSVLSANGAEHEVGTRGALTIGGAATVPTALILDGGTILARDSFDPQAARFIRMQSAMSGSGTINVEPLGSAGGNSRIVFQRGDVAHTFTGTFVALANTALELNPRNNDVNLASAYSGNAIGGGTLGVFPTLELRGFNSSADVRNAGGVATRNGTNFITGWNTNVDLLHDNNIAVTGTDAGGIQRLVVTTAATVSNGGASGTAPAAGIAVSTNITGGTGNVLHFKNLAMGNNRLLLTNGNSYGARFDTMTLTGATPAVATIETNATAGKLEINGNISEHLAGDGLARWGNLGELNLSGQVGLATLNIRANTVNLFGPNGAVVAPNLSAGGSVIVNGGGVGGAMPAGLLNLNSNLANTDLSVVATDNLDRLADTVPVTMLGNSVLRLTSLTGIGTTETTGNVTVTGFAEFDIAKQGVAASAVALTLGSTAAPVLNPNSGMSFTAVSLGVAGADTSHIFLFGQGDSAFLGANYAAGTTLGAGSANEWVSYDFAGGLGVIPFGAGSYNLNPGVGAWANHVKVNVATALGGPETAATVNIQVAGALALGANNLTLTAGGILASTGTNGITGTTGILTTGAGQQQLFVTNNVTTDVNAIIADNGSAVTLVKNGTGNLRLTNQGQALGAGSAAVPPIAATHANTFTGGIFVNSGTLEVWKPQYIGGNQITLQGGSFAINQGSAPGLVNTAIAWGNNVVVNTNSSFVNDDNGESNDASVGQNTTFDMGTLTINGAQILSTGGFVSDNRFTGATFSGNPTINLGVARSTNSMTIINGVQAGSGFQIEAFGNTAGSYVLGGGVLGGGGGDTAPNSYSGVVYLGRTSGNTDPILRLDKMNGVLALTGDLIINQGTLAFGPGLNLTNNTALNDANNNLAANRFAGISIAAQYGVYASGQDQIAPTATITLLAGNLGENARINNQKFGTLIQKNGTLNPGFGVMEVDNWQFSGGAIAFNSGGTFRAGAATLLSGAQEINIANNFIGSQSRFEIGTGGLTLTGQSVSFGGNSYTVPGGGAVLQLGGPLTVNADPLNLSDTDRQKGFFAGGRDIASGNGRELARNVLDLDGGVRDITIDGNIFYAINTLIEDGGFTKKGPGSLAIQNWFANSTTLDIGVAAGNLIVRGDTALGSSAVTVSSGGTLKLDGGWTLANGMTLSGPGALIPNGSGVREFGALVAESGYNRVQGPVAISGATSIGANFYQNPSTAATGGGVGTASPAIRATLSIESAGGITGTGNLTITGSGDGLILNGLKTTVGGLKKEGSGTWTIAGESTYPGATTVEAGILRIAHNDALGTVGGATTVFDGNTLGVTGGINSPEALFLYGTGFGGGVMGVVDNAGTNTLSGLVTLGSDTLIRSTSGILTLGGVVVGTDTTLTVRGAGGTTINGIMATGAGAVIKNDAGNLTLRGANSYTGETSANGGTLTLDYTVSNTDKVSATADLNLGGGSVAVIGNAGAATTQLVNRLELVAGGGTVSVAGSGGQPATLNVGAIVRSVGASANFATASNGFIVTTAVNDATGILGGYATFGSDWAEVTATKIQAYTGLSPAFIPTSLATDNALLTATGGPNIAPTVNSLKITGGSGFQTPGLALTSGGLLYSGNGQAGIAQDLLHAGSGLLTGLDMNADLFVHTTGSGTLSIGIPIIGGGGSLVKAGPGSLMLGAPGFFTGNVHINGGTLEILGPGGTADATVLGGGTKNIHLNGGGFAIRGGDYDPGAGTKSVVVGAAGGVLSVANGQLLLNDGGQLSGAGTVTKTGAGTLNVGGSATGFTGDVVVQQGILRVTNNASIGALAGQSVSFSPGTVYVHETTTAGSYNFDGTTIGIQGGDRQFLGAVNFSGTNRMYLGDMIGALQTARSVQFAGPISGSGSIDLFGNNQNGRLQIQSSSNTFTGTFNLNANTGLEFRPPSSAALTPGGITVNLNGANSRVLIRHYTGGDFNLNVNVSNNVEIFAGQIDNYGLGSQALMRVNSLAITGDNRLLVINGSGSDWLTVNTAVTAPGNNTILNTLTNAAFMAGASFGGVSGGIQGLDKRGGSVLATYGPMTSVGPVLIQAGTIDLRSGGTLTAPVVELRGNGSLMFSNNVAEGSNANRYTGPITLAGGTLRVFGTTNLGNLTVVGGSNNIRYSMDTQTGYAPLVLTGLTARPLGTHVQINSDFGTVGAVSLSNTNPRIHFPAASTFDVDTFGTGAVGSVDIIPGFTSGNEFIGYRTALDGGVKIGLFQANNNFMRTDAADGAAAGQLRSATAPTEIMRLTASRTLAGSAVFRALKMDGASTTTLDVGANLLRIERGMVIHVANDNRIGGTGNLTAGVVGTPAELQFTVNAGNLFVNPKIVNNGGAGVVSVVKNGAGQLILEGSNISTYTGGTYVNAGVLQVRAAARLGTASPTNGIIMQSGTLELNVDAGADNTTLPFGHDLTVRGNSFLGLDNGATGTFRGHIYQLGKLNIPGPYTLQTAGFDNADVTFANGALFAGTPTIDLLNGRASNAAGHTEIVRIAGDLAGSGFYVTSTGAAAGTNPSPGQLFLGDGPLDFTPNTYSGTVILAAPTNSAVNTLVLDKAAGTKAITGNVVINGGVMFNNADNQIDDAADITVTGFAAVNGNYGWNLNAKTETIGSLTMNGGLVTTGALGQMNVTGNVTLNGTSAADGLQINSGTALATPTVVTVGGNLTVNEFGRAVVGAGFAALEVGSLTLNGGTIVQNTGGNVNNLRLNGNVTATSTNFAPANIGGNTNDSDTYLDLRGTRIFNVANGPHGIDLILSGIIQNGPLTGLGATGGTPFGIGKIVKTGAGVMSIQTTNAAANTFTGGVEVQDGTLELARTAGNNTATGTGAVTIGDASGAARSAILRLRNSEQIANASAVTINSDGLLDLDFGFATETIGSLNGSTGGAITLGPTNTLIVTQTVDGTYSGEVHGAGSLVKTGAAKLVLDGILDFPELRVDAGRLDLAAALGSGSSTLNANATTNISVSQTLGALNIAAGVVVTFGTPLPAFAGEPDKSFAAAALPASAVTSPDGITGYNDPFLPPLISTIDGTDTGSAVVPEPGSIGLLMVGALGILARRRRGVQAH